jgi:hypothetical protein
MYFPSCLRVFVAKKDLLRQPLGGEVLLGVWVPFSFGEGLGARYFLAFGFPSPLERERG